MGKDYGGLGHCIYSCQYSASKGQDRAYVGYTSNRPAIRKQYKGLKTVDKVNAYLPHYIKKFNDAFSVKRSSEGVAWHKAGQHWNDKICKRYPRVVDMGNCMSFMNYRLQIDTPLKRSAKVEIRVADNKLCSRVNEHNYSVHMADGAKQEYIKVRKMINLCIFKDEKCE